MFRLHSLHPFSSCNLFPLLPLLLFLSSSSSPSSGQSPPHMAHHTLTPDGKKTLFLEALKMGILGSLGLDKEPRPKQKSTEQELERMFQLYREKVAGMGRNSSQMMGETGKFLASTMLFPATVKPWKVLRRKGDQLSAPYVMWHRAAFHKNSHISSDLPLIGAELRISRGTLNPPGFRRAVKVKVNGLKPLVQVNVSIYEDVTLDLSPEVQEWTRTDGDQMLTVDVGLVGVDGHALQEKPTISLELGFKPAPRRTRRSNKEDDCDERGWCCRKSETVSFKEIGWTDWVVAPEEYTMHYCDGSCPHNYKPASMHTQVKSRLNQMAKGAMPRPCCVPAAYEPMVLMHYDSKGKLKLTAFDDFIVSRCHCA